MSKRIKSFTEASACKALNITTAQLSFLLNAVDTVMQEIAPDVCSLYKKGCVPRFDMIEMVCDCSRIEIQLRDLTNHLSSESAASVDDLLAKLKDVSMEVRYGVVGMELNSRVYVV